MKKGLSILIFLFPILLSAQEVTNKIVVDQFGYRPQSKKVAVIRDPHTGFDASEAYSPGNNFVVINTQTKQQVFPVGTTQAPVQWNNGAIDASSGDKAWWFDFSAVTTEGTYYVLDVANNKKSFDFEIKDNVYQEILKQAMRSFFYQRSGYKKEAKYAGTEWADEASHMGPLQDLNCRSYDDKNNSAKERDVHGGWYDAGDYNKYTTWTANYVVELLRAYSERPEVWTDDYNIPESGNGTPDILDEVKWGIDHLIRLQNENGSTIAIIAEDGASPPSAASGQSFYGAANTSSTLSTAGAFAFASKVYRQLDEQYANDLLARAKKAWDWAVANPNVTWKNNDEAYGSKGIGAGQQETDDYGRLVYKLRAATFLLEATQDTQYKTFFENNYEQLGLIKHYFAHAFSDEEQDILLYYSQLPQASNAVSTKIIGRYTIAMNGTHQFQALDNQTDPYMAHLKDYTWGNNRQKSSQGLMYYDVLVYNIASDRNDDALAAAEDYLHYLHGVNPKNLVYLSNMYKFGGDNCVNQFYHSWFYDGTDWDEYGKSKYGPAPGFVVGGANPRYTKDACCPSGCGSPDNNAKCNAVDVSSLLNQPNQKSYLDFNTSWPLNSWTITENSGGYQTEYIRLISKFVEINKTVTSNAKPTSVPSSLYAYPNPTTGKLYIQNLNGKSWTLYDMVGQKVLSGNKSEANISNLLHGIYLLSAGDQVIKIVKK